MYLQDDTAQREARLYRGADQHRGWVAEEGDARGE